MGKRLSSKALVQTSRNTEIAVGINYHTQTYVQIVVSVFLYLNMSTDLKCWVRLIKGSWIATTAYVQ